MTGSFEHDLNFDSSPFSFTAVGYDDIYIAEIDQTATDIIEQQSFDNLLSIVPNPTVSHISITAISFTNASLHLCDITTRTLLRQPFSSKAEIDLSSLTSGVYIVEVKNKEGRSVKGKLVKE